MFSIDNRSAKKKLPANSSLPAIPVSSVWSVLTGRYSPIFLLIILVLSISFFTRVALLAHTGSSFGWSLKNVGGAFSLGALYDLSMSAYLIIPFVFQIWLANEKMYQPKWKWVATAGYLVVLFILFFTNLVPTDFNSDLKTGVNIYCTLRFVIFIALAFTNFSFRRQWRTGVLYFDFFLVIFLLLFNGVSEYFFWDEFSVRYNFIAVDYLVYTNEVLGNIRESYPLPAIILSLLVVTTAVFLVLKPVIKRSVYAVATFPQRTIIACILLTLALANYYTIKESWRIFSKNEYANELAGNGIVQFTNAFFHHELDYYKFYKTLPDTTAFRIVKADLQSPNSTFLSDDIYNLDRRITYAEAEQRHNVVLISVESLSAEFMKSFGSDQNIMPYLDSLADEGILFTSLYASGTRTVRGLEALSLSLPPSSGESIVKRPGNENLFSLGSIFKAKGYITQYIYGGYSYFDNMKYFFSNNGYEVIDRDSLKPAEIHYSNIWGVADEDLFTLAGRTLDSNFAKGKPFFSHIMTVSNHRPYTYPTGRIDLDPANHTRAGAVKYTDYAINRFIKESALKPWYNNTLFVIVADHCAGSAGSVELPVTGYHIPMVMFGPGIIKQPQTVNRLMAQIDIAPTILGMLYFNYISKFFGQDIFNLPAGKERAFISTYQGLGFIQNKELIIQSPVKKVKQYRPDFITGTATEVAVNDTLSKKAIAYYQAASWMISHKKYGRK